MLYSCNSLWIIATTKLIYSHIQCAYNHYILSSTSLTNTVLLLSFSYLKYYILPSHFILYNPHKYYILPSHNPGILLTFLQRIPYFRYFSYIFFIANPINPRFFKKSGLKNGQFSFFKNFLKNMGICKRPKIGHRKNDLSKHILDRTNIGVLAHFKILFLGKIAN